ncbi:MAG: cyclic nucleotide-binding domain-containing protein, partial [Chloroflexota bacterium]
MPTQYQETHIRNIPMFANLSNANMALVTGAFQVYQYNAGDVIVNEGQKVPGFMIVADGQLIRVQFGANGERYQRGAIYEGQYLYQNALFEQQTAGTYIQAVRPTTLLILTRLHMSNLLTHHPELRPVFGLERTQDHFLHDVHFKTQRENERVLLKTRRHWWTVARWLIVPLGIVIIGAMVAAAFPSGSLIVIVLSLLIGGGIAGYLYVEWMNDSVIITDQRVIRITHTIATLQEVIDEVALESIQEANAEIATLDIAARLFRYGDVELKTAGAKGNFMLAAMPNPEQLQDLILEDARNYRIANQSREREAMQAEVERWIRNPQTAGQAVQKPPVNQQNADAPAEQQLRNIYGSETGPISPFMTSFRTPEGGVVYRKHWFIWLRGVLVPSLWIIGSIIAGIFISLTPLGALGAIGWAMIFIAFLVGVVWFYWVDWDWRHDYYFIQDNNITIVNRRPLWLKNESDQVLLKQVDNVVAETKGLLQQLFSYGDVRVALVGADEAKLFDNVAKPRDVQAEITRRQQRQKQRELESQENQQREIFGQYISLYHQQQNQGQQTVEAYPETDTLPYDMPSAPANNPHQPSYSPARPNQRPPQRAQQPPAPQQPQQLPVNPQYPNEIQRAPQLSPSPLTRRPTISKGRPFQQNPNQPARPARSPYRPQTPQQPAQNSG